MKNRQITDHRLNGLNEKINISVLDEPGPGGANHSYEMFLTPGAPTSDPKNTHIVFQNGPIKESGFNGFSNEALIAIAIDRMRGFQMQRDSAGEFDPTSRGPYACKENACALTHLEEALMWLQKRTRDRLARGVEGTNVV